jgi:rhamnosyl/mannosyltransferase
MKILHIYKNYYPVLGGIENHIKLVCEELAKDSNFDVRVLVTNSGRFTDLDLVNGVQVIRAGRLVEIASTPLSLSMARWVRTVKPDLIHLHYPYPPGDLSVLLASNGTRVVLTYHGDIVRQRVLLRFYFPLLQKTLARAEAIIASNPNYVASSETLRVYKDKIRIIPYGIDCNRFLNANPDAVRQIREKMGDRIVLFVGRFRYYKGLDILLTAAHQISAKILLIGDGPASRTLVEAVGKSGLRNKVFFLKDITDAHLPDYYHAADIFVLPSTKPSEAFGITLLEAMAAKKPVVSTELGTGTSFVNQSGKTGLVIPAGDPRALADAVNYLMANPELRRSMGQAGHARVGQEFSSDKMLERLKNIYTGKEVN